MARGEITEEQAIESLEYDFNEQMREVERWEIPCGLAMEELNESDFGLPEEEVLREEVRRATLIVINELTGRQARVVEMYYFDGLTVYEIADRFGITHQGVSDHLVSARKKITQRLQKELAKSPISSLYSEGQISPSLLKAPSVYRRPHRQFLFPYELARYADRLDEYIRLCFKDDRTVLPRLY